MELSAIPLGAYRVRVWQAEESRYSCPGSGWGVFLSRRKGGCGTVSEMRVEGKRDWQWENPPANAGDVRDVGSILGWGRSPGRGHGNPLQYSFLENPMDRGAWQAIVHRVKKSRMQLKRFSTHARLLQIFFPSLWFVFSFSWLSFAEQKFLFLVKSSWWMISLVNWDFGATSKESLLYSKSFRFYPIIY